MAEHEFRLESDAMIRSMTAFASLEDRSQLGALSWDIRSVNHRFLELVVRLPDELRDLEPQVRERATQVLQRGKVECRLRYQSLPSSRPELVLNEELAKEVVQATRHVDGLLYNPAPVNAMDILRWPGIIVAQETAAEPLAERALQSLDRALAELVATRDREGAQLRASVEQRLDTVDSWTAKIRDHLPQALAAVRDILLRRLAELRAEVDDGRLHQELALLLTKSDIAEELERLDAHAREVRRVLAGGGAVGRRLDFLMQELHREANTLGVKAADADTANAALELKVLVEQMREQVQNIE
jgi:uncharacterized protein (TIGR00255 family)